MKGVADTVRGFFDIREGEHLRLWSLFFYLLFVLFAYYIVKPVSRAMFLTKFDIDKLPGLYILIAVFGGLLAYVYSKVAAKVSLGSAVSWAMGLSILTLVALWSLIRLKVPGMVYALNIWVSLFSVILVSQGWLVAGNLFDARQAKRLYPILDMGMVIGAAFGGEFTQRMVALVGTNGLLLASAFMVLLAYVAFLAARRAPGEVVREVRAGIEKDGSDFSFRQIGSDLVRVRHLQIIVGMMVVMYLVDTLVEYQFQAMARHAFTGDHLTAFFGQFYGLWLNGVEFLFQLFLTGLIVRWFGIGATLQISPIAVGLSSVAILAAPGVLAASAVRLTEASTRYTLSKTGMELLYMPLPLALRNRVKAFIDICVDRLSRGLGGVLLLFLTTSSLKLGVRGISVLVVLLSIVWIACAAYARREYVASIRKRLAAGHLDLASTRMSVTDAATVGILESAALRGNSRQASYAIALLESAPKFDMVPLLRRLAVSGATPLPEKAYEVGARHRFDGLLPDALQEIVAAPRPESIAYILAVHPSRTEIAFQWLHEERLDVVRFALRAIESQPELSGLIRQDWLDRMENSEDASRRALAAIAVAARGDRGTETLHRLLADVDTAVVQAALESAGKLRNRAYLHRIIISLGNRRVRGAALSALSAFGAVITGTLSDVLNDEEQLLSIRRQIPRVLRNIANQHAIDILLGATDHADPAIRTAALKALSHLRQAAPNLIFDETIVTRRLLDEAQRYYEISAALAPFRGYRQDNRPALRLLAQTMEDRLRMSLDRLFRLLGLRYPPRDIYSAYLAVSRPAQYDAGAALEFLDNLLDRDLKRVLLPLLDAPQFILDRGRELFGIRESGAEEAIRAQIDSGDTWLAACASAVSRELALPAYV